MSLISERGKIIVLISAATLFIIILAAVHNKDVEKKSTEISEQVTTKTVVIEDDPPYNMVLVYALLSKKAKENGNRRLYEIYYDLMLYEYNGTWMYHDDIDDLPVVIISKSEIEDALFEFENERRK